MAKLIETGRIKKTTGISKVISLLPDFFSKEIDTAKYLILNEDSKIQLQTVMAKNKHSSTINCSNG